MWVVVALGAASAIATPSCEYPDYVFVSAGGAAGLTSGGMSGSAGMAGEVAQGGAPVAGANGVGGATGGTAGTSVAGAGGDGGTAAVGGASNVLFEDDFEDGDAAGWFATDGTWSIVGDGGNNVYEQSSTLDQFMASAAGNGSWADVVIEADVKVLSFGDSSTSTLAGVYARFLGISNHYYLALRGDQKIAIRKKVNDSNSTVGTPTAAAVIDTGNWYHLKFSVIGSTLSAELDGAPILSFEDTDITGSGPVAVGTDFTTAQFDNVVVYAP